MIKLFTISIFRFLLPYERYQRSTDSKGEVGEVGEVTLDETSGNLINGSLEDDPKPASPEQKAAVAVTKEHKPYLGLKPLQLLTDPGLIQPEEEVKPRLEDSKLRLDDLIIVPGNLGQLEEGGSALQNLAKIASRYSSLNKDKSRTQDFANPTPKKARVEEKPGVGQPLPPTSKKAGGAAAFAQSSPTEARGNSSATASALLQQFSLLSPSLFGPWAGGGGAGGALPPPVTSPSSSTSSWLTGMNLDPNMIGQEGYNLLKYYEQQLKALQQGAAPAPAKANGVKEAGSRKESSGSSNKGGKEKQKVSKPPPDTKKPPKLMQSPCQFLSTTTIYGSPNSDLIKAKESAARRDERGETELNPNQVLDLSSLSTMEYRTISPHRPTLPLNAATAAPPRMSHPAARDPEERAAKVTESSLDLSTGGRSCTPRSDTSKLSPFSAEALLSRPSSRKNESPKSLPPLSMGIKGILEPDRSTPSLSSPWQPPPASKPAAPVPPVVRSSASSYYGVSLPSTLSQVHGLSTETTFSSLASLPTSSLQPPVPTSTNPYLQALMAPLYSKAPTPGFPGSPLDPLSQYYAALYSQQLSAYSAAALGPYAAGLSAAAAGHSGLGALAGHAGLQGLGFTSPGLGLGLGAPGLPGLRPGYMTGTASAELQALQAYKDMMTRSALSQPGLSSLSQPALTPPTSSAASNPYAALYAGLMGYPGFPQQRKDS